MAPKEPAAKGEAPKDKATKGTAEKDVEIKEKEDEEVKEETKEEEAKDEDPEAAKEAGKPTELEEDAKDDLRAKIKDNAVMMNMADATLNVMPVANGKLLMTLTEGGFQYLLAGVRATAGVKAGRYMFEVKIIESLSPSESQGSHGRTPQPKNLVRLGVSTAGSSLFLSDGPDNVCFDSEGYFVYEKTRKKVSQKFSRDQTVAVLLNLDPKSPNANTISLFRNGQRISEPQAIPEKLLGKALFPTITYKNVTLQVNFGPVAAVQLPFKCLTLAAAAQEDIEMAPSSDPKDGKYEVLFPVGLPEQGFFDWVDHFIERNPDYTELSDRKILEWASKSGIWRPKGQGGPGSNDKPDMKFGVPMLDDMSVRKVINAVAPTHSRCYIVPELKANLIPSERGIALQRFSAPEFKKTAIVIMGEPSTEYKERVQSLMLADKQAKVDAEKKKKAQEEERKRLLEEKKKKAEEARKAKEAAQKKKEGKEVKEAKEEEEVKEEQEEQKEEDTKMEEDTPVELSAKEKGLLYRKLDTPDLDDRALAKAFADFALPTAEEGFSAISYAWQPEAVCADLLKKYVLEKKMTQRVEDLQPGAPFKEKWTKWQKTLQEWRKKQTDFKDPAKKKAMLAKKKEAAKKKKEADEGEKKTDGDAKDTEKEEEAKPMEINAEDLDVFSVEDVTDIGNGEPLFAHFVYEDWALLSARCEFHLLLHAFKQDLNDPDRPSFTEGHMPFYYNKYFKKSFNLKNFGVEKLADFVDLIKDTLTITEEKSFLESVLSEDTPPDIFVKLTEDHRRERQRRMDAGDETAKLKFTRPAPPPPRQPQSGAQSGGKTSAPQQSRYGAGGGSGASTGAGTGAGAGSYSSQKRPYSQPPASYGTSKQPRTSSYGSSYGGSGYYRR